MKLCSKCGEVKELSDYYVKDSRSGRLHSQCKSCYKKHRKTYYNQHYETYKLQYQDRAKKYRHKLKQEYRANMLAYMKGKYCVVCGETDIVVLELDHINPSTKVFSVSQAIKLGYKWSDVLLEIKKCQVLCANCHKRKTAKQFGWYRVDGGA